MPFLKDRKEKGSPVQKLFPFCRGILGSLWTEMAAGQKEESSAPGRACLWGQGFPNDREALRKAGIGYLTVYAFSTENWARPQEEIDAIMNLLRDYLKESLSDFKKGKYSHPLYWRSRAFG